MHSDEMSWPHDGTHDDGKASRITAEKFEGVLVTNICNEILNRSDVLG